MVTVTATSRHGHGHGHLPRKTVARAIALV